MPENNEKVEDFISLWRKKMEIEINKPSVIEEKKDRIKEIEEENELLRTKIKENIELINKTEKIVKNTIDENEKLKEQLKQAGMTSDVNLKEIQQENINLSNQIIHIEKDLSEKEVELRARNHEITELKTRLEVASKASQSISSSTTEKDSTVTTALIDDLRSELSKKKSRIDELNNEIAELNKKIAELEEENKALNDQLVEKMKKLPIDYVVPVEQPKSSVIKPQSNKPSSKTLELLCQDLQSDLNKYKKIVDKLNKEKSELQLTIEGGGFKLEPDEIKQLKRENEELKNELSQVQMSLKKKSEDSISIPQVNDLEKKISEIQKQLDEKNRLIEELKTLEQPQPIVHKGPMSDLVEDLQNRINKLKITIDEKNKIIEQLKSS